MSENMSIDEASSFLASQAEKGAYCPCCGQFVKAYRRIIRGNHARFLLDVARKTSKEQPWVHYKKCIFGGRDYNYLRHFGLAETQERTGFWQVTEFGMDFIREKASIPAWIVVYNNKVLDKATNVVTIRDCLKRGGFDYDALMAGAGS